MQRAAASASAQIPPEGAQVQTHSQLQVPPAKRRKITTTSTGTSASSPASASAPTPTSASTSASTYISASAPASTYVSALTSAPDLQAIIKNALQEEEDQRTRALDRLGAGAGMRETKWVFSCAEEGDGDGDGGGKVKREKGIQVVRMGYTEIDSWDGNGGGGKGRRWFGKMDDGDVGEMEVSVCGIDWGD